MLRLGLGVLGLVVAAAAVVRDDPRIGWGAIALLAGSLIVRLLGRRTPPGDRNHSV
jgi:hypothetical protein